MSRRHTPWFCLLLVVVVLAGAAPSAAQSGGLNGFQSNGDYVLEVDGQAAPSARFFALRSPAAILIIASQFPAPVLLSPSDGSVRSVQLLKVAERGDGTIDLLPDYILADHGSFTVDGSDVRFSIGSLRGVIGPKPPLLGLNQLEALRAHDPGYVRREQAYEPSQPILDRLRATTDEVRVRVFFGSWCPACSQMVPRIMRVADALRGSKMTFEFYGLPRGFDGEPEAERYDVHSVPTAVIFVNGREAGRIGGNGWRVPELALNNLLSGA